MTDLAPELLTVSEIASELRVNPQTVRNWIERGELPAVRVGKRRVRVQRSVLETFVGIQPEPDLSRRSRKRPVVESQPPIDREAAAMALDQIANGVSTLAEVLRPKS
jgi:excisionase family DNA binding protein